MSLLPAAGRSREPEPAEVGQRPTRIQPFPSFSGNYDTLTELRIATADMPPPVAPTAAQMASLSGWGGREA